MKHLKDKKFACDVNTACLKRVIFDIDTYSHTKHLSAFFKLFYILNSVIVINYDHNYTWLS